MSEQTTTQEDVKQEGDFKIKKKTPKKLVPQNEEPIKVNIKEPLIETPSDTTKVVIPSEDKKEEDAIQIGETKEVSGGTPSGDSDKVEESVPESNETIEGFSAIQEVTEEKVEQIKEDVQRAVEE